nr:DUF4280 domain-containing protein [uncultured Chryseobacterium sp.]
MPQIITENACLSCDKGAASSFLKVTSNALCRAANQLIATENDKQTGMNISSFGMCSITQIPCIPAVAMWSDTAHTQTINNMKILTVKSTCQCSMGGKISVVNKGHGENHEAG